MLFTQEQEARITEAIRAAESGTSGEVRVYVEDICPRDHPVDRAAELFHLFGMFNTKNRNGVLLYLAEKSRQFALWGDTGIHSQVGFQFWDAEKKLLREYLQRDQAVDGVCATIYQIGEQLRMFFPSDDSTDENELPNDVIYG